MNRFLIAVIGLSAILALIYLHFEKKAAYKAGQIEAENSCKEQQLLVKYEIEKTKESTRKRIIKIKDINIQSAYDILPSFCQDCSSK